MKNTAFIFDDMESELEGSLYKLKDYSSYYYSISQLVKDNFELLEIWYK